MKELVKHVLPHVLTYTIYTTYATFYMSPGRAPRGASYSALKLKDSTAFTSQLHVLKLDSLIVIFSEFYINLLRRIEDSFFNFTRE